MAALFGKLWVRLRPPRFQGRKSALAGSKQTNQPLVASRQRLWRGYKFSVFFE